jgi:hypothetical protein
LQKALEIVKIQKEAADQLGCEISGRDIKSMEFKISRIKETENKITHLLGTPQEIRRDKNEF